MLKEIYKGCVVNSDHINYIRIDFNHNHVKMHTTDVVQGFFVVDGSKTFLERIIGHSFVGFKNDNGKYWVNKTKILFATKDEDATKITFLDGKSILLLPFDYDVVQKNLTSRGDVPC